MQIESLKKELYDRAIALGVKKISLHFSGGSDEGYLYIDLMPTHDGKLAQDIENWAWDTYGYGGAGDGSDYGDDIVYDLENNKATASEWYTARTEGDSYEADLEIK